MKVQESVFTVGEDMPCAPKVFALHGTPGSRFSPFGKHEFDVAASYLLAFSWKHDKWVGVDARTFLAPLLEDISGDDEVARLAGVARRLPVQYTTDSVRHFESQGLIRIERIGDADVLFPTAALVRAVR